MKQIAIIIGGYSEEFIISIKSAEVVFENIDTTLFIPYKVYINKHKWVVLINDNEYNVEKSNFSVFRKKNNF